MANPEIKGIRNEKKAEFRKKCIKELRLLGRKYGVKSPTSISKRNLIDAILKVAYGEEDSVNLKIQNNKIAKVTNNYEMPKDNKKELEHYFESDDKFKIFAKIKLSTSYEDYGEAEFLFSEVQNGYYINEVGKEKTICLLDYPGFVCVQSRKQDNFKLEKYDNLKFKISTSAGKNNDYMIEVLSINGCSIEESGGKTPFNKLIAIQPAEKFKLTSKNNKLAYILSQTASAYKGSRVLIISEDFETRKRMIKDIIDAFIEEEDERVFPILLNYSLLNAQEMKNAYKNTQYAKLDLTVKENIDRFIVNIGRAIKYVENGKSAVIVIDDLNSLLSLLSKSVNENEYQYALNTIANLFSVCGSFKNGGKLTLCAFASNSDEKLLKKLHNLASIILPENNELLDEGVYPAIKLEDAIIDFNKINVDETAFDIVDNILEKSNYLDNYKKILEYLKNAKATELKKILNYLNNK